MLALARGPKSARVGVIHLTLRHSLTAALAAAIAASAAAASVSSISVRNAWIRPAVAGMNGAAYLVIDNRGPSADALVAAESPLAASVSLHRSMMVGSVMTMRLLPAVAIPARGSVSLAPGGYHLMLERMKRTIRSGQQVPLRLTFRYAGAKDVELTVQDGPPA